MRIVEELIEIWLNEVCDKKKVACYYAAREFSAEM